MLNRKDLCQPSAVGAVSLIAGVARPPRRSSFAALRSSFQLQIARHPSISIAPPASFAYVSPPFSLSDVDERYRRRSRRDTRRKASLISISNPTIELRGPGAPEKISPGNYFSRNKTADCRQQTRHQKAAIISTNRSQSQQLNKTAKQLSKSIEKVGKLFKVSKIFPKVFTLFSKSYIFKLNNDSNNDSKTDFYNFGDHNFAFLA